MTISNLLEPKNKIEKSRMRFSNRDLIRLILPILVEQLLTMLVGIADTLMVSYAGEAAVSGVSLVNQLNNVFIFIFGAIASGGAVVASQYVGRQDRENGVTASGQLLMFTVLVSAAAMAVSIFFRTGLLRLLFGRVEADVMDACITYLTISALSFPALAVYNSISALFRSMGKTKAIMNVSIAMNIINVVGNAIGIFVLHAGVAGVAVPSLISRIFAAVVMLILSLDRKNSLYIQGRRVAAWDGKMLKRILNVAVPNGVENGLFQISKVALSSIVALFGTVEIAANGVAQSFWSMASLFCIAFGYAFVTVIGQCMGAGDVEAADYYNRKLLRITYLGSTLWNILILVLTPPALMFFDLSDEAKHLVILLVLIHNVGNLLLCPLAFSLSNGLRAAGDIRYTMFASIFATVICRVFFSVLFGIWMDMGVIGIALAMVCDWLIKAILVVARYRSGKWTQFQVI
ncbi:MATE family efflux transporter [Intestinimonas butyriciproducens]|uniref:MATE family efflux transporter n=1 Tax=Intestinimonas butyriciproducens TaxID=1297617 RepID=UPI00189CEA00|nr:MATE family efflux transporter [Intestinimonas butyriciproducens]